MVTTASDFEFLPYDVNFQRCQRYYSRQQYVWITGKNICSLVIIKMQALLVRCISSNYESKLRQLHFMMLQRKFCYNGLVDDLTGVSLSKSIGSRIMEH